MANYNYANPGAAFAQAFTASFTPFLQMAMKEESDVRKTLVEKLATNFQKAKEAYTANQATQAQYIRDGQSIASGMTLPEGMNFSKTDLAGLAAQYVYANKGNVAQAQALLIEHIKNGMLTTKTDVAAASRAAVAAGANPDGTAGSVNGGNLWQFKQDEPVVDQASVETQRLLNPTVAGNTTQDPPASQGPVRNPAGGTRTTASNNPYDTLFRHSQRAGGRFAGVRPTEMTANQWLEFQAPAGPYGQWVAANRTDKDKGVATPMGAFQIVGTTLRGAMNELGWSGNEVMNEANQEKIAKHLYDKRGLADWGASINATKYTGVWEVDKKQIMAAEVGLSNATIAATAGASNTARASAAPVTGVNTPTGTNLGTMFSLPSLDNTNTGASGVVDRLQGNIRSLFSRDGSYTRSAALVDFKKQLEASGELALYNDIVSGRKALTPFSATTNIGLNLQNIQKQDFPSLLTITSPEAYNNLKAGIDNGLYKTNPSQLQAFRELGDKYAALPQGLPRDWSTLNTEQEIKNAKQVYNLLTPQERSALPTGYAKRLEAIFETVDSKKGVVTIASLTQKVLDKRREGETALSEFLSGGDFANLVDQAIITSRTDSTLDANDRLNSLVTLRERIATLAPNNRDVLKFIDDSISSVNFAAAASKDPAGTKETIMLPTENGDYRILNVTRTADPVNRAWVYKDDQGNTIDYTKKMGLSEEHVKLQGTVANQLSSTVVAHRKLVGQAADILGYMGEMAQLVSTEEGKNALTAPITSNMATVYTQINNEVNNFTTKIAQITANPQMNDAQKDAALKTMFASDDAGTIAARLATMIKETESDPASSAAAKIQILKAKQILIVYAMGGAEGQSGTAMSNKDFERLKDALESKTVTGFMSNMKSYAETLNARVQRSQDAILNDEKIQGWETIARRMNNNQPVKFFAAGEGPRDLAYMRNTPNLMTSGGQTGYDLFIGGKFNEAVNRPSTPAANTGNTTNNPAPTVRRWINGAWRLVPDENK
jgi:hypothetical protein